MAAGWLRGHKTWRFILKRTHGQNHISPGSSGTCGASGGRGRAGCWIERWWHLAVSRDPTAAAHTCINTPNTHTHRHTWARLLGAWWVVEGEGRWGEDSTAAYSCGHLPSSPPRTCYTSRPLQCTQHSTAAHALRINKRNPKHTKCKIIIKILQCEERSSFAFVTFEKRMLCPCFECLKFLAWCSFGAECEWWLLEHYQDKSEKHVISHKALKLQIQVTCCAHPDSFYHHWLIPFYVILAESNILYLLMPSNESLKEKNCVWFCHVIPPHRHCY